MKDGSRSSAVSQQLKRAPSKPAWSKATAEMQGSQTRKERVLNRCAPCCDVSSSKPRAMDCELVLLFVAATCQGVRTRPAASPPTLRVCARAPRRSHSSRASRSSETSPAGWLLADSVISASSSCRPSCRTQESRGTSLGPEAPAHARRAPSRRAVGPEAP